MKARNFLYISVLTETIHYSDLTQEIRFLEFMGRSNLMHAHLNYLICMHSSTVTALQDAQRRLVQQVFLGRTLWSLVLHAGEI